MSGATRQAAAAARMVPRLRSASIRATSQSASVAYGYANGSSTRNAAYESAGAAAAPNAAKSAHGFETTVRASP